MHLGQSQGLKVKEVNKSQETCHFQVPHFCLTVRLFCADRVQEVRMTRTDRTTQLHDRAAL